MDNQNNYYSGSPIKLPQISQAKRQSQQLSHSVEYNREKSSLNGTPQRPSVLEKWGEIQPKSQDYLLQQVQQIQINRSKKKLQQQLKDQKQTQSSHLLNLKDLKNNNSSIFTSSSLLNSPRQYQPRLSNEDIRQNRSSLIALTQPVQSQEDIMKKIAKECLKDDSNNAQINYGIQPTNNNNVNNMPDMMPKRKQRKHYSALIPIGGYEHRKSKLTDMFSPNNKESSKTENSPLNNNQNDESLVFSNYSASPQKSRSRIPTDRLIASVELSPANLRSEEQKEQDQQELSLLAKQKLLQNSQKPQRMSLFSQKQPSQQMNEQKLEYDDEKVSEKEKKRDSQDSDLTVKQIDLLASRAKRDVLQDKNSIDSDITLEGLLQKQLDHVQEEQKKIEVQQKERTQKRKKSYKGKILQKKSSDEDNNNTPKNSIFEKLKSQLIGDEEEQKENSLNNSTEEEQKLKSCLKQRSLPNLRRMSRVRKATVKKSVFFAKKTEIVDPAKGTIEKADVKGNEEVVRRPEYKRHSFYNVNLLRQNAQI